MRPSLNTLLLSVVLGLTVAACSGGGASTAPPATSAVATAAATTEGASSSEPSASADVAMSTVNANTATVEELQAAFEAAGISNADKWAREVAEYRPYPADPAWAQLRQELGKYNIAPDVLEKILAILEV